MKKCFSFIVLVFCLTSNQEKFSPYGRTGTFNKPDYSSCQLPWFGKEAESGESWKKDDLIQPDCAKISMYVLSYTLAPHVIPSEEGKIVGGYNTTIDNFPYQVYLLLKEGNDYYQCGGSIISEGYVLTAAHCLVGKDSADVRIGSTQANSGGTVYKSSALLRHPQYNSKTSDYDVGIIKVSKPMKLDGTTAKIIKLADSGLVPKPGTKILVSGWGATSENGETSNTLMAVKVPIISNEECNKSYKSGITSRMFCAGLPEGGKDSCQGDSGGPAVKERENIQLGIVSFGIGCARSGFPGVYTNVARVRSWIRLVTSI